MRAYQILEVHGCILREPDLSIRVVDRQALEELAIQQFCERPGLDEAIGVLQRAAEQEKSYHDNPVWIRLHHQAQTALATLAD